MWSLALGRTAAHRVTNCCRRLVACSGLPSGPRRRALAAWLSKGGCGTAPVPCPKPPIPHCPWTQVLRVRTASRELDDMTLIEHDEAHRVWSKLWSKPSEPSERVDRLLAMAQVPAAPERHPASGTP